MATVARAPRPYHHGDLRMALLDAAVQLAREDGPAAVTLREVSRRVQVSHNAAYRHYQDHDALLDAVAGRAFAGLTAAIRAEQRKVPDDPDPTMVAILRARATGSGYLAYARREPGLYAVAFSRYGNRRRGPALAERDDPYRMLSNALDDLVAVGALSTERRPGMEYFAWSAVHGLATLLNDGPLRMLGRADRVAATDRVLDLVGEGLVGPYIFGSAPGQRESDRT